MTVMLIFYTIFGNPARAELAFPAAPLSIAGAHFTVEEARSPEQMERGLMFRESLAPDRGMLFIFESPQTAAMWMKDTQIPLDMLFIDARGKIVYVATDTVPESENIITAGVPVKAVLELAAGTCEKRGIKTGDAIRHAAFAPDTRP